MALEQIGLAAVLDDKNFQQGLARYSKGIGQMTKLTDGAASVLSGAFFAATGIAVAGIGALVAASKLGLDATLQWAEGLDKLGDQFGMSGEVASGWQFLMNRVGLSVDEGAQGLNYFTKQLDDFGKATKTGQVTVTPFMTALQKLGVSAYDSKGKLKDFDAIMPQIMDKFSKLPAGVNASALAMDLFGARGGTKFLDFLRQGGAGLKDATAKAKALGLELSTDEVNAAEEFGFAMNELNLGLLGFKNTLGRAVLPIAKQFVEWLNKNAIPPLVDLAKRYAPLLGQALRTVGDILNTKVFPAFRSVFNWIQQNALPIVKRLFDAFKRGGWGQLWNQMVNELRAIWPRLQSEFAKLAPAVWNWVTDAAGRAGEQVGKIATSIVKALQDNWPSVSAQLSQWGAQLWGWLTTDVGPKAAANIFLLANSLNTAIQQNWPTVAKGFEYWKTKFWNWLTGAGGVIDSVSSAMDNLSRAILAWAQDPKTARALEEIGARVAATIIDGIGQLFSTDQNRTDSAMSHLVASLNLARLNLAASIAAVGGNLAADLVNAIVSRFGGGDLTEALRAALYNWFTAAIQAFVLGNTQPLIQMIIDGILGKVTPPAQPTSPGVSSFQHGGYVPQTGLALVHRGEYVIPARQAQSISNNNSRTIMPGAIVFQIQGGSSLTERQLENVAYRVVGRVLNGA